MRVFVTGSTGFIGSATVKELLAAGHEVLGLVRSDAGGASLVALGVPAHRGDLTDVGSLVAGAKACDGVTHTAFIHDFSRFAANIEVDRLAVQALVGALEGSGKPLAIASGTALAPLGQIAVEQQAPRADAHRADAEATVMAAAGRGVRGSIVRVSPTVHGAGEHGFVPMLIDLARRTGVAAYVGDGATRWPAVHRLDAARLFRLALEQAPPAPECMPPPRRACRCAPLPRPSRAGSASRPVASVARKLPRISAGWRSSGHGQPDLQRLHPRVAGVAADGAGVAGGPAGRPLLRLTAISRSQGAV